MIPVKQLLVLALTSLTITTEAFLLPFHHKHVSSQSNINHQKRKQFNFFNVHHSSQQSILQSQINKESTCINGGEIQDTTTPTPTTTTTAISSCSTTENPQTYIRFSRAFQRHVVYQCKTIEYSCTIDNCHSNGDAIASFTFLDDALQSYPNGEIMKLCDIALSTADHDDDIAEEDNKETIDDHKITIAGIGTFSMSEIVGTTSCSTSASMSKTKNENTICSKEKIQRSFQYLASISSSAHSRKSLNSPSQSIYSISPFRFVQHNPDSIHRNYNRVMDLLTRGRNRSTSTSNRSVSTTTSSTTTSSSTTSSSTTPTGNDLFSITKIGLAFDEAVARTVIAEFPQICLYDIHELEDRIKFLISPLPTTAAIMQIDMEDDYYKMLKKGYGAGLTIDQATTAIKVVPQFLSIFYEDSRKPSMIYFYKSLRIPPASVNEARTELSQYMLGCDASDVCSFAYLHSLGVTWDQIRLLLDAFPTLTYFDKEPSWDLIDTKMRSELQIDMLMYLRKRLQISNADVHSMLKVHSRLSTYSVNTIKAKLDALQSRLGLSSQELKRLVLRMPSMIGMEVNSENSISTLDKKVNFFLHEVKLTPEELRKAIAKMPSLLQYSLESLRSKCFFLTNDVKIPSESLQRVISLSPVILGLSLEENLKPTVAIYKERGNLSSEEIGQMMVTCPALLSLSVKRKIEPCFAFLESNLSISTPDDVGSLIHGAPRIFLQGIETSLKPKVEMIQDAVRNQKKFLTEDEILIEAADVLKSNPALLVTTNAILKARIKKAQKEDPHKDFLEVFAKNKVGRKRKFQHQAHQPKLYNEKKEISYESQHEIVTTEKVPSITFSALVSGQIFPRDTLAEVRGKRKAGGIALSFPRISMEESFSFEDAMEMSFGMIMPQSDGGSDPSQHLALLGFPFLRPSRNRCDLYACHGALKVVLQLLRQVASKKDMRKMDVHVKIYTDSSYAWKYLKNSTELMQWGSVSKVDETNLDSLGPVPLANPDLLLPLTKTMYKMCNNEITDKFGETMHLGNIKIDFLHSGDFRHSFEQIGDMNEHAYRAAKWQFSKG